MPPSEFDDFALSVLRSNFPTGDSLVADCVAALNGVERRYQIATEANADFAHAATLQNSHRRLYLEDRALFIFHSAAVSTVECLFYACYFLGARKRPRAFPTTANKLKKVTPENVAEAFKQEYPRELLTRRLCKCLRDTKFQAMLRMRNVLMHRVTPSRMSTVEFDAKGHSKVTGTFIPGNPTAPAREWRHVQPLTPRTTERQLEWLAKTTHELMRAAIPVLR